MYRLLITILLLTTLTFAQELSNNITLNTKTDTEKSDGVQAVNDKITFKDGSNVLLEINSESSGGSLILPNVGSMLSGNKLYNNGTHLYWGSSQLDLGGISDNDWTISGSNIYNSNTGNVGIGTNNPLSKLSVGSNGSSNVSIYGSSSDNNGIGILGYATFNGTGTNYGGSFTSLATSGIGVRGFALNSGNVANYGGYFRADGKFGSGVYAWSSGESGYGVYGYASNNGDVTNYGGFFTANGNYGRGVYSFVNGTNAVGVFGEATNSGDVTNYGGYFLASGNSGQAVYGSATNTGFVYNYGGYFAAAGTYGRGVYGLATGASGSGVYGESNSTTGNAIFGYSTGSNGNAVYGYATGTRGAAIRGYASNTGSSTNYGGYFEALANNGRGIYASCTTGYAGYFLGNVLVNGYIYKSGGSFKIDHPLDPANKNLYHSFVESPDMMNIYNGNILTDESGNAQIKLPDWFEALNKDFRYQLTVIGEFAQAIVSEKIKDNKFTIKTNKPNVEVSWQITGIRHDAFANANRIPVEEMKPEKERGKYIHPEAFNMPKTSGIAYDEKMELEKIKMEEEQLKMAEERIKMEEIRKKEEQRVNVARLKIEKERNMSQELGPEINVKK